MKKIIMLLCTAVLSGTMAGQVLVNLQLPTVGLSVKSQLWNMTISNSSTEVMAVKITMIMTDIGTGQQVLSGSTGLVNLPQGNNFFQYGDILPVSYVVLNSNYAVDASPEGFLPPGNYNICYEVLRISEITERMTEECADAAVESLSPPYLTAPDDLAEIDESRPVFSWLPPTPVYLLNGLSYKFKLVEILPNQTSADAIEQNFPLISEQNVTVSNLVFPASQSALDTGKTYAWQVIASNNGQPVSSSEIWTFKLRPAANPYTVIENSQPYVRLKTENPATYFICEGILKMEYINEVNDSAAQIRIYDFTRLDKKAVVLDNDALPLRFGQNLISIDIRNADGIVSGHQYIIEITNSKNEIWRGKFLYRAEN